MKIALAAVGAIILVVVIGIFSVIGTVNDYSRIETKAVAVQTDNTNVLDNTRKAIREAGSVSAQEVKALENIIIGYADARGPNPEGGSGNVVSIGMVREAVPSITSIETLKRLQNIVVAGRADWQRAQTNLIDIKRQGDTMLAVFPSSFILSTFGKKPIGIKIITSAETEQNFATGRDDSSWVETVKQ
jgi:hypothetical protein